MWKSFRYKKGLYEQKSIAHWAVYDFIESNSVFVCKYTLFLTNYAYQHTCICVSIEK